MDVSNWSAWLRVRPQTPGHTAHSRHVRGLAAVVVSEKYPFLLSFVPWLFYFILSQSLPLPTIPTDIFLE